MPFSLNDKHIIVNYHYIEDPNKSNSGMHPCPIHEFEKQITSLLEHYAPASIAEIFQAAKEKSKKKLFSITFDDGLKVQYQNAVPILKKHRVHGTFFIITGTLEGFIPYTHKLHILLSRFSPFKIIEQWNLFIRKNENKGYIKRIEEKEIFIAYSRDYSVPTDRRWVAGRRLYEDIPSANIKEMFSRGAPKELRDKFIGVFFQDNNLEERVLSKELFMSEDEIKDLSENNLFEIGNHTHGHEALTGVGADVGKIRKDLTVSQQWFKKLELKKPTMFSYPHGLRGAVHVLRENGFLYAVTAGDERGVPEAPNSFLIPRYEGSSIRDFLKK